MSSRTLCFSSHSLLNTIVSCDKRALYLVQTDMDMRESFLSRVEHDHVASSPFASIEWPSTSAAREPLILVDGTKIYASDMLVSTGVLTSSRKFRIPGYTDPFKWKRANGAWQCYSPCRTHLATFVPPPTSTSNQFASSLTFHCQHSDLASSRTSISDDGPNVQRHNGCALMETILLTTLLLISHPPLTTSSSSARRFLQSRSSPSSSPTSTVISTSTSASTSSHFCPTLSLELALDALHPGRIPECGRRRALEICRLDEPSSPLAHEFSSTYPPSAITALAPSMSENMPPTVEGVALRMGRAPAYSDPPPYNPEGCMEPSPSYECPFAMPAPSSSRSRGDRRRSQGRRVLRLVENAAPEDFTLNSRRIEYEAKSF